MREYGRISTRFWTDEKIQRLSDHGKLLLSYFLTGPHTNCVGCFRLPFGYIKADLEWVDETVIEAIAELLREGLIERCEKSGWTLIVNFLKHNPIENPNVGKSAMAFINLVPTKIEFYQHFISTLQPYVERFPKGYINGLAKGIANREPEPYPEPYPEPESVIDHDDTIKNCSDDSWPFENLETDAALHVWNDLAQELGLVQVQKLTEDRKVKLKARLRDTQGIAGWASVLVKIRDSRFLQGNNKNNWRADFDFVLQEKSFNRLKEGSYSDKKALGVENAPVTFKLPDTIVKKLKSAEFTDTEIKGWFDDAEFSEGGKRIGVKSAFVKDWISSHYETRLRHAFGEVPHLEVKTPSSTNHLP